MNRLAVAISCLLLLTAACAAQDDKVFKTYRLKPDIVAGVGDTVMSLIGTNGSVATDESTGKLMVFAAAAYHKQIAELLDGVNTPRNIEIAVTSRESSLDKEVAAGAASSGSLVVTPTESGARVRLAPRIMERAAGRDSVVKQTLTVTEGREASLRVGTEVPCSDWLLSNARQSGYVAQDFKMQHIGASLCVQARILADGVTISIRVVPELSGLVGAQPTRIRYTRLATELTVRDGATLSLAGLVRDSEFYDKFLTGSVSRGQPRHVEITLTPSIMRP